MGGPVRPVSPRHLAGDLVRGDRAAFDENARLAADEYRYGRGSPLGARFERLMDEGGAFAVSLPSRSPDGDTNSAETMMLATAPISAFVEAALTGANDARERARRSLEVLCNATGATAAHLYLLGEDGARLAASLGELDAPQGLGEFLLAYSGRGLDDDGATELVSDETHALDGAFVAANGTRYSVLLLTCLEEGDARHAAAAALVVGEKAGAVHHEITVALGTHLLRAGDATGIRA